jgi:hypothetical protein
MTNTPQDFVPEPLTPQQIDLVIQAMNDSISTIEFAMTLNKNDESYATVTRNVVHLQGLTQSPIFDNFTLQNQVKCFETIQAGQSW